MEDKFSDFASSAGCSLARDNVGNMYISRPGEDPGMPDIALAFQLNAPTSKEQQLPCAFEVFQMLQKIPTKCGITLLGWCSSGNDKTIVGREVWDGSLALEKAYEKDPGLKKFAHNEDISTFSVSAVFDLAGLDSEGELETSGSPLLTLIVSRVGGGGTKVEQNGALLKRAPMATVRGRNAAAVVCEAIQEYSDYVEALFENFD